MVEKSAGHAPDELLTVGEMSRRTGVAVSALHFYEQLGLIASTRTPGNQRRYARHMLRRVSLITVAKRLGIPLSDVQEAFADVPMTVSPRTWQVTQVTPSPRNVASKPGLCSSRGRERSPSM